MQHWLQWCKARTLCPMNTDRLSHKLFISLLLLECICTISNYWGTSNAGRLTPTSKHSSILPLEKIFHSNSTYLGLLKPLFTSCQIAVFIKKQIIGQSLSSFLQCIFKGSISKRTSDVKSYQQRDKQRRFSDHTACYNPAIERSRVYKTNQQGFNYANYYKRPIQGLICLFL